MKKQRIIIIVFTLLVFIWSMLAWGLGCLLNELSSLMDNVAIQSPLMQEGILSLIPEVGLNTLQTLLQELVAFYPGLIIWLGYIIWIFWGMGVIILLVMVILGLRLLNNDQT